MTRRVKSNGKRRSRGGASRDESLATMYDSPYVRPTKDFDGPGMPNSQEVILRYAEVVTGAPTTGQTSGNNYRFNGLYQPRVGGGTQPTFFDQMMALYQNYCVVEADLKLFMAPAGYSETAGTTGATVNSQAMAIIAPFGSGAQPSTATSDVMEWPGSQASPMSAQTSKTVAVKVLLHKAFGLRSRRDLLNNPNYWGSSAANPTTMWLGFAGIGSLSGNLLTYGWDVRLRFKTVFFNPVFPAT